MAIARSMSSLHVLSKLKNTEAVKIIYDRYDGVKSPQLHKSWRHIRKRLKRAIERKNHSIFGDLYLGISLSSIKDHVNTNLESETGNFQESVGNLPDATIYHLARVVVPEEAEKFRRLDLSARISDFNNRFKSRAITEYRYDYGDSDAVKLQLVESKRSLIHLITGCLAHLASQDSLGEYTCMDEDMALSRFENIYRLGVIQAEMEKILRKESPSLIANVESLRETLKFQLKEERGEKLDLYIIGSSMDDAFRAYGASDKIDFSNFNEFPPQLITSFTRYLKKEKLCSIQ